MSSTPEWLSTAIEYGLPILGALGGYVGAAARFRHRLKALDDKTRRLSAQLDTERTAVHALINSARAAASEGDNALTRGFEERLRGLAASLGEKLEELERDTKELQDKVGDGREQSAHDHAANAALARDIEEVKELGQQTHATLNQILGYLKGTGAKL